MNTDAKMTTSPSCQPSRNAICINKHNTEFSFSYALFIKRVTKHGVSNRTKAQYNNVLTDLFLILFVSN